MEFLSALVAPILERLVKPVLDEIGYVFQYKSNMESFTMKVERVKDMRDGVKERIEVEERNLQSIAPDVKGWLDEIEKITAKEESILEKKAEVEKGCFNGYCPNLKLRYTLSKKAKKGAKVAVELIVEGSKYSSFSVPAPPLQVEFIGHRQYIEFESRKSNEEEIVEALMDGDINLIGICGMGGVGKTMMARKVGKRMTEEMMFDEFVLVAASLTPDPKKIQQEIAEGLGLQLKEENPTLRANKLQRRLALKRTLIVLDDIWARLDLEELGIAFALAEKCKVILTSRHRDTCAQMDAQKIVVIEILQQDEGWSLFKERAGSCVSDPDLHPIARDVSRECSHLPLALTTVGRALRDKSQHSWEDARTQLRRAAPINIPEVLKEVYQPLELSYQLLESNEAKSLFLLCSLFPEDYCIPLEFLIWYGVGLRVFENITSLEEARTRVYRLVEILEDRFLLDDAAEGRRKCSLVQYDKYVKMHHVLRDVAIYIANKEDTVLIMTNDVELPKEISYENLACISIVSNALTMLPETLICPNLDVLRLECGNERLEIPKKFFYGMPGLVVLDMPGSYFHSLPPSLGGLRNLRVLYLDNHHVEEISIIGKLVNLEILICFCRARVLPVEIGRLVNLRVLNLGDTCIQIVAPGIIANLTRLEEVYMINNNCRWEGAGGREGSNATLHELGTLPNLTALEIQILEPSLLHTNISFRSFPKKYFVFSSSYYLREGHLQKAMYLSLPLLAPLGNWVRVLLRTAQDLYLDDIGSKIAIDELVPKNFCYVKKLILQNCSKVEFLANTTMVPLESSVFPILESLCLLNLINFKKICNGPFPAGSMERLSHLEVIALPKLITLLEEPTQRVMLRNLQGILIDACPQLQNLLSLPMTRGLVKLRDLDIYDCESMQEVFSNGRESGHAAQKVTFPKLNHLKLQKLPNLTSFCQGVEDIEFPQLRYLEITNTPKFKSFCDSESSDDLEGHSLFNQQVKFDCLKRIILKGLDRVTDIGGCSFIELESLRIESCNNLTRLFSPSVAKAFANLKEMEIGDCLQMEEVISNERRQQKRDSTTLLPKLEKLKIAHLPELRVFWQVERDLELPLLKDLEIDDCPKMKAFTHGSLYTPSLNQLMINRKIINNLDINVALQQYAP
ncbi:PREDICTED: probable disease resistance protein At4g27220 [Ipomoea nil]|uniref:probable disease resistance protein At4g27220 n=1 Tax=Ipomoea nil TaxID=35883 RepID=UPI00090177B7|nr:PREDICTED: probable disease resistance protein At4g27220 [Ipomoea nil]XP_019186210.1 PREDICTED: probable disease resistance protein At4g27220 [Ipomoea nil]